MRILLFAFCLVVLALLSLPFALLSADVHPEYSPRTYILESDTPTEVKLKIRSHVEQQVCWFEIVDHLGFTVFCIPPSGILPVEFGGTGTNSIVGIAGSVATLQVFSGFYGGGLPTDVPTTSAALAYDKDSPNTTYQWDSDNSIWY